MKSFKNHFFIISFLISIFISTIISEGIDFETEKPVSTESSSKSFLNQFKKSEFNRRLSSKINDFTRRINDFFKSKENQLTLKPINDFSKTTSSHLNFAEKPTELVTYRAEDWNFSKSNNSQPIDQLSPKEIILNGVQALNRLTPEQLNSLNKLQIETILQLKNLDKYPEIKEKIQKIARLKGISRFTIYKYDKNFTNIFKSDKTILKEFIQNALKTNSSKYTLNSEIVKNAIAKLSRSERIDLFNDITHEELTHEELKNTSLLKQYDLLRLHKKLFSLLLPPHELLITTESNQNFKSIKFKIVNMREFDPKLTIAENAQRINKIQNLNFKLNDLETQMREYLITHPSLQNLKILLVDAINRTRKDGFKDKTDYILKIFNRTNMKKQFDNLSPKEKEQFITSITQEEIRLQEKNMNLAGSGAKVSYAQAKKIFQENASIFEEFLGPGKILVPSESASLNNISSFKFETINISFITEELNQINMADVNLKEYFKQRNANEVNNSPEYNDMIRNTGKLINLAEKLKREQNLTLNITDIAQELKDNQVLNPTYLRDMMFTETYSNIIKFAEQYLTPEEFEKINKKIYKTPNLKELAFHHALLNFIKNRY